MTHAIPFIRSNGSTTLRVEVIRDVASWRGLQEEWDRVFGVAHNPSPPLHFDWLTNWWDVFGEAYSDGEQALRILCFRQGPDLAGVLPLYLRKPLQLRDRGRRLCFIGTGEVEQEEICSDYLDLMCVEELRDPCSRLAWDTICGTWKDDYDWLTLSEMSHDSSLAICAQGADAPELNLEVSPSGVCPIADLTGGFEAYLSRLSSNTRQQARRALRAAAQAGVTFEVAKDMAQAQEFFGQMVDLHQSRWQSVGEPGCFASSRFCDFHQKLLQLWQPSGRAILSRLSLNGEPLAVKYGFRVRNKYDFYQSGVKLDDIPGIKSAGIVSFLMLMQHLTDQGVTAFDFLRGSSSYKQRLATTVQPLVQVRRVRWNWRTGTGLIADLGGRAIRKVKRSVSPEKRVALLNGQPSEE